MRIFSSENLLHTSGLFDGCIVAYHSEFEPLVNELARQQVSKEERLKLTRFDDAFKRPSLDLSSLFDQVRRFGEPVSSSDKNSVQTFVQECKSDVELIRASISETITNIASLCRTVSEASCRLAQRKRQAEIGDYLLSATHAPIQSLPQEILEKIFLTCFDDTRVRKSNSLAPNLQLAAVCYQWRMIALGIPALWRYAAFFDLFSHQLDRLKLRFERCPTPFLSLTFPGGTPQLDELMALLAKPVIRIRALEVTFTSKDEALKVLPAILSCNSGELEELVICSQDRFPDLVVPNIQRLYIHKAPVSWSTSPPPVRLTNLLITSPIHWSLMENIFVHCLCLQQAVLSVAESEEQFLGPTEANDVVLTQASPRVLPELVSFSLVNDCKYNDLPSDLLQSFSFPALRAFEYYVEHKDRESITWLTSHDLLSHIRRLTLQGRCMTREIVTSCIKSAYSLEELSISCDYKKLGEVLQPLIDIPSSYPQHIILPQLKALQLASQSNFEDLKELSSQVRRLVRAWSTPTIEAGASAEGRPHRLTHLKFLCWTPNDNHRATEFRDAILQDDGIGDVKLEIIHISSAAGKMVSIPLAFEMYQAPFNEVRTRARKILQADGSWREEYGPVYRLAD
ncbi:hypothetical protein BDN72DRAFT_962290 [Pluteus cervinus]|uniref:Uncharacterized protein n=1 Tax=Pluteus cervinus TaxID=181527 RepID=A0ACD3AJM5_9AGAR|nr:hypothetical protein BDN72DRAFT_962290 [Pluteus cervinus]